MKYQFAGGLLCLVLGLGVVGCTANVDDPDVDQSGNQNDGNCTKECEDARTTCTGQCDDDGCRGNCTTEYEECSKRCE